jgi:hypothetical protein
MRFVADLNNMVGIAGLGFACGIGWTAGCWLMGRLLSAIKI